jgi:DNA polymerase-3 subunit delta
LKLPPQRIAAFLRDPGPCRVVLLYGEDYGMIHDRSGALVRAVAGSLDDPFLVAELGREGIGRLADEALMLAFTGRRRVVRLREATDAATEQVATILNARAPALVVLEAPGLPTRSRLRTLIEAAPEGVSIACYPEEGRALAEAIRATLAAAGVGIDSDALAWASDHLGVDRASTLAEAEKLVLFAGPGGRIDLNTAMTCLGDLAGLSLEDALFAATEGDLPRADRALELAFAEGISSVGVLRAALMHLQRLHRVRLVVDGGVGIADAVKRARPPIFFRRTGAFSRAIGLWSSAALLAAAAGLAEAERACKNTGAPDSVLSRHAVLVLARRAAAVRRRNA